jgi:hypothetical protein
MTIGIGQVCLDGILLASDSLLCADNAKSALLGIKGFEWRGLSMLYAGDVAVVQRLQSRPNKGYPQGTVSSVQQLLWDFPMQEDEIVEFLVVDQYYHMYTVDHSGTAVRTSKYAVIGSKLGLSAMYMVEPRARTMEQAKRVAAKVMRAVEKYDNSVAEPFYYWALPW